MNNSLSRGKRGAGDLIPWTISQQFNDHQFGTLSGARVVRIATHPEFQKVIILSSSDSTDAHLREVIACIFVRNSEVS